MTSPSRRQLLLGTLAAALSSAASAGRARAAEDAVADLHNACVTGDVAAAKRLLAQDPKLVDRLSSDGTTPLGCAVTTGNGGLLRALLDAGANRNSPDGQGQTPLTLAVVIFTDVASKAAPRDCAATLLGDTTVSVKAAGAPLRDVLARLFASANVPADIDSSLTEPISATVNGGLDTALTLLLRLARRAGQPLSVALAAGRLKVTPLTAGPGAVGVVEPAIEDWPVSTADPGRRFLRRISHEVLLRYISRAVTHYGLCSTSPEQPTRFLEDDIRMLTGLGAKFIGRSAYAWVPPDDDEAHFRLAAERAARVHQADPEIILQACVFEAIYDKVERIPVPAWVFAEFGLPVESRNFRYDAMLNAGNKYHDHWTRGASIPDITRRETRMYFYYRARRYIDAGFESMHWGQVHLMDEADAGHLHWRDLLTRVRHYASHAARRLIVICDAHTHGVVTEGNQLLFDLHAWPLMARDAKERPQHVHLELGYYNCIYHQSAGGITPSGWSCESLPYVCEFDCGGVSDKPGQPSEFPWNWGYSCGDWFAHQPADYRREFIVYAHLWLRALSEEAFLQMPTRLNLAVPIDGVKMWHANHRSSACTDGFDLEDEIRAVWRAG